MCVMAFMTLSHAVASVMNAMTHVDLHVINILHLDNRNNLKLKISLPKTMINSGNFKKSLTSKLMAKNPPLKAIETAQIVV